MLRHPIRVGCRLGSISSLRSRRSIGILARTSNLFASEQQQPQQRKQTETSEKNTSSASQEAPNEKPSSGLSMFAKLKQYGPVGLLIYLTIHSIGFWITFCAVYCGFPVKQFLAEFLGESYQLPEGPWAEFAIALAVNKCFVPLQIIFTIAITPKIRPILLAWGPTQMLIAFVAKWKAA